MISEKILLKRCLDKDCKNSSIVKYNGYASKIELQCISCGIIYRKSFHSIMVKFKPNYCSKCRENSKEIIAEKCQKLGFVLNEIITFYGCKSVVSLRCECGNTFTSEVSQLKFRHTKVCQNCIENNKKNTFEKIDGFLKTKNSKLLSTNYGNNKSKIDIMCSECGNSFKKNYNDCTKLNSGKYLLCPNCRTTNSSFQMSVENFLIEEKLIFQKENRKILKGKEIDFLINEIGIETDGIYWHSELAGRGRNYHLEKTILAAKSNVQLIHIFENEWLYKKDIVKSIIKSKFNKNKKIYGRNCKIIELNKNISDDFLNKNHIQGQDHSSIRYGLSLENELVSIMTFSKSRYSKKYQWELSRFSNKLNNSVLGGASKLLKYFIIKNNPISIGSYADRRYSIGNLYQKLGFNFISYSKPSYFYFKGGNIENLFHRKNFQKKLLKNRLKIFDEELTEWENMKNNGWNRIWDCGHSLYVLKVKD